MVPILIRMVLSDLLVVVGIVLIVLSDGLSESLTLSGAVGVAAVAAGCVGSAWSTMLLVRFTREQRLRAQGWTDGQRPPDDHNRWE